MDIRIKTLMGNSLHIPNKISVKEKTYYKYVREKINNIIIQNSYTIIDYDLLANGEIMRDHMEVKSFEVTLVPKLETGYNMTMNSRKVYIPLDKVKLKLLDKVKLKLLDKVNRIEYSNVVLKRRDIYTIEKEERELACARKDNMRTRRILDDLKRKREAKRDRRARLKRNKKRINYCGFRFGFLL